VGADLTRARQWLARCAPSDGAEHVSDAAAKIQFVAPPSISSTQHAGIARTRGLDTVRGSSRWGVDRRLALVVGLVAAVPVLASTVHAIIAGWTPVFDDAIIATRSIDVLSAHPPLVGEYSDAWVSSVGPVFTPGPMLFWLFAFQTRFMGDWALPVTMGLVNAASIIGVVALARRRGGRVFMFTTAFAVAVMCRSLPGEVLHDMVNPSLAVLPFTLLLFLAWSVACGEYRLLPLMVLVASFVVQAHFSVGVPGLAISLVALASLAVSMIGNRSATSGEHRRRWLFGALGVALVCWSAPLIDQAFNRPGNFVRIVQTATVHQKTLGTAWGVHAVVKAIGIPPWWLRGSLTPLDRLSDLGSAPNAAAIGSCLLVLGGLSIVTVLGLRRRRRDLAAAGALALALNAALLVLTASTPSRLAFSANKSLFWASPAGMFTWLALGWSLAVLVRPRRWGALLGLRTVTVLKRPAVASFAGLGIVASVAAWAVTAQGSDAFQWTYRPVRALESRLVARLPRNRAVLVLPSRSEAFVFRTAVTYQLRRRGYHFGVPQSVLFDDLGPKLGKYYSLPRHYDDQLLVDYANKPVPRGGRVLVRIPVASPESALGRAIIVWDFPASPLAGIQQACPPARRTPPLGPTLRQLRTVAGRVVGYVDGSHILGNNADICGWAANLKDHRVADAVLVFADGRLVSAVKPAFSRPDIVRAGVGGNSGFSVRLPVSAVEQAGRKRKLQIFGIERGIASPLRFLCANKPQDLGC
jgi:hypothetical protein